MKFKLNIENKQEVIKWLDKVRKGTGDARPLWMAMLTVIPKFVQYEFSDTADTHKLWPSLTPQYKTWKENKSYPTGIGVLFGKLREGASNEAEHELHPDHMLWILNQSNVTSKKGYKYAPVFNWGKRDGSQPARPIFKYTAMRVSSFLKLDAKKFASGARHASFTYTWLRKVLRDTGYTV